jgi:hypothetical protein
MRSGRERLCATSRWAVPSILVVLALAVAACGGDSGSDALHACNIEGVACAQTQVEISAADCPANTTAISSCSTAAIGYCSYSDGTVYVYDSSAVSDVLARCESGNGSWTGSTDTSPTTPVDDIMRCRDLCFALSLACQGGCPVGPPYEPYYDCQHDCQDQEDSCLAGCG